MTSGLSSPEQFAREVIRLAIENVDKGGGPFAALVVRDGKVIGRGVNQVTPLNDPTAHAEVQAIREACARLCHFELKDCDLYTSCEPCPMCLGAVYWSRLKTVYFCATRDEAAEAGFDDRWIYDEAARELSARRIAFHRILGDEAKSPFTAWRLNTSKTPY